MHASDSVSFSEVHPFFGVNVSDDKANSANNCNGKITKLSKYPTIIFMCELSTQIHAHAHTHTG